jgi:hypothetical protein
MVLANKYLARSVKQSKQKPPRFLFSTTVLRKGKIFPVQAIRVHEEVEVQLHSFFNIITRRGEWSALSSVCFISEMRAHSIHCTSAWVGPDPVWTLYSGHKLFALLGIKPRFLVFPARGLDTVPPALTRLHVLDTI